jgi:hypothetical protein
MTGRGTVRARFIAASLLCALAAAFVGGCGSSGKGHRTPSTPVTGTFHEVGGPAPGVDIPLAGDITVYSGTSASGIQVTVLHTDAKGHFHVDLNPGTFFFVGRSPIVSGASCTSSGPVVLTSAPASVAVTCSVP